MNCEEESVRADSGESWIPFVKSYVADLSGLRGIIPSVFCSFMFSTAHYCIVLFLKYCSVTIG